MAVKKIVLGKMLLDNSVITELQLDAAVERQKLTGEKLGRALVNLGFIKEEKLLTFLSQQLDIPYVDLKNYELDPKIAAALPEFYARRFRAIILNQDERGFLIGMADPLNVVATDDLGQILNKPIQIALVKEEDLLEIIDVIYRRTSEISTLAEELSAELKYDDYDVTQLGIGFSTSDAPVVKLLQNIFEDAVQVNASDVHIEPDENVLRIRQRIDGVLHEQVMKEKQIAPALTLRIKLMGGLNIAEKRLPQDGRFSIKVRDKNYDIRLSTMPVQHGESVVMRLLNQSSEILSLSKIGMPQNMLDIMRKISYMPNGLFLITGPTGSGKTTTLYGILSELNTAARKILTVEDPVEYRLPRINQIQVQQKIDLSFSRILRSILRQDPDIIMIGELRDQETALIAMRAAMTGHFVLSTLHTNDAVSSAVRLIDMGAEGYIVATVLRGILAQRLVRRVCKNCSQDYTLTASELAWVKAVKHFSVTGNPFKHGIGCAYCHNTGFKGQVGIFELLQMTPPLVDALRQNNTTLFGQLARESEGFHSLVLSGLEIAVKGVTTVSEIIRIIGENFEEPINTFIN